jgi:hypothetical protein
MVDSILTTNYLVESKKRNLRKVLLRKQEIASAVIDLRICIVNNSMTEKGKSLTLKIR